MIANPTFIPINMLGGIGDIVLSVDFLREMNKLYDILVYTKHCEALKYFLPDLNVHPIMHKFAWHMEIDHEAKFKFDDKLLVPLASEFESLYEQSCGTYVKSNKLTNQWDSLCFDRKLQIEIYAGLGRGKYITVHDGYDPQYSFEMLGRYRSTKQWSLEKWAELISKLKTDYPGYQIIQLGAKTSREIPGISIQKVNDTTITECFDILRKSSLHIDGDSGLVHAASRMGVPCVVMWGPTDPNYYGWNSNINLKDSPCESGCHPQKGWMKSCLKGFSDTCVDNISVERVLEAASTILTAQQTITVEA